MTDGLPISPDSSSSVFDNKQKGLIRLRMKIESEKLIGIPYAMGKCQADYDAGVGQWRDFTKLPENLDCQGLTKGVCNKVGLKFPEGAQNQFNITVAIANPQVGDFAFFGHDGDITKVYHVGMVFDDLMMIEARGVQPDSNFETGKVIFRPRIRWEKYIPNFLGYRSHSKLI